MLMPIKNFIKEINKINKYYKIKMCMLAFEMMLVNALKIAKSL